MLAGGDPQEAVLLHGMEAPDGGLRTRLGRRQCRHASDMPVCTVLPAVICALEPPFAYPSLRERRIAMSATVLQRRETVRTCAKYHDRPPIHDDADRPTANGLCPTRDLPTLHDR